MPRSLPFPALILMLALGGAAALSLGQQDIPAQIPDLASLPDLSDQLQAQIEREGGAITLANRRYRITRPLVFDQAKHGAASIRSAGGNAILIMDGPGPAIRLTGSHQGTAGPESFRPETWREAMPVVEGIVILGNHPQADGIELFQCVQPVISRVSVRGCRHGIRLVQRNRNVTISDCHLYENEGAGIFLDDVNLHQINITNCHVSYNRQGGIVVRDGNVRNLQITGCDIESNMPGDPDTPARGAANILLDVSGSEGDRSKSIAEVAITGCTIQHSAHYGRDPEKTVAPGGANIRLLGKDIYPIDTVAITGNVLSDTTVNVHIDRSTDIILSGNTFFAPKPDHLVVNGSQRVVVAGNTFNPREFVRPGALRFTGSRDCILSASAIHDARSPEGALILEDCEGFLIQGLNLTGCEGGIVLKNTRDTLIAGCRVGPLPEGAAAIAADADSRGIQLEGNRLHAPVRLAPGAAAE